MVSPFSRLVAGRVARLAVLVVPAVLVAAPAGAHTDFIGSVPKDGANLDEIPREVALEFSDDIDPQLSTIALRIESGRSTPLRVTVGATPTVLVAQVPDAIKVSADSAKRWTVAFRVVSRDGHPVAGTVEFVVRTSTTPSADGPGDDGATTPSDLDPTEGAGGRSPDRSTDDTADERKVWPLVAIGVGALVLLIGAVAATMRLTGRGRDA